MTDALAFTERYLSAKRTAQSSPVVPEQSRCPTARVLALKTSLEAEFGTLTDTGPQRDDASAPAFVDSYFAAKRASQGDRL